MGCAFMKTPARMEIPHDLSYAYNLKAAFGEILGSNAFQTLKECHDLGRWKQQSERLLKASLFALEETVKVSDQTWNDEVRDVIRFGISTVRSSETIDNLFASLAATYARLSFLQIGLLPRRLRSNARLRRQDWKRDTQRTVQYVQSNKQRHAASFTFQQRLESRKRADASEATFTGGPEQTLLTERHELPGRSK
jgi:hypothetical protein